MLFAGCALSFITLLLLLGLKLKLKRSSPARLDNNECVGVCATFKIVTFVKTKRKSGKKMHQNI